MNSALGGFGLSGNAGDNAPAAYLNYLLFDQQYKVVNAGWVRVPTSANFSKQKISLTQVSVKEAGFIFAMPAVAFREGGCILAMRIRVTTEPAPTFVGVYFDDFKVTHTKSNLIQGSEYYPYGLQTANSWTRESNTANNFLYNGGTELNQTTQVYDLYYRNYDPVLGRFGQVDPMAGKYGAASPYNFGVNNPVRFNDPMGDDAYDDLLGIIANGSTGSYVASGRGESVYRDMDPYGRYTGARIMAQSIELQTRINNGLRNKEINNYLNSLLSNSKSIFSQAWNAVSDKWDGGAGSFAIVDGKISDADIWKITISSPTSENELIAEADVSPPGFGGGPFFEQVDFGPGFDPQKYVPDVIKSSSAIATIKGGDTTWVLDPDHIHTGPGTPEFTLPTNSRDANTPITVYIDPDILSARHDQLTVVFGHAWIHIAQIRTGATAQQIRDHGKLGAENIDEANAWGWQKTVYHSIFCKTWLLRI